MKAHGPLQAAGRGGIFREDHHAAGLAVQAEHQVRPGEAQVLAHRAGQARAGAGLGGVADHVGGFVYYQHLLVAAEDPAFKLVRLYQAHAGRQPARPGAGQPRVQTGDVGRGHYRYDNKRRGGRRNYT